MSDEPLGFEPIWEAIKKWDIQREHGAGYHGTTGDDVGTILFALADAGYAVVPVELLRELANDLAAYIAAHYGNTTGYPSMDRKRAADMEIVTQVRAMLAAAGETQA
jgi:hypothetical protein